MRACFIELRDTRDLVIIQASVNSIPGQYLPDLHAQPVPQ